MATFLSVAALVIDPVLPSQFINFSLVHSPSLKLYDFHIVFLGASSLFLAFVDITSATIPA